MKKIPLTQNKFALVDDKDFDFLNQWKWCYNGGYAIRIIYEKRKGKRLKMHNVLMQPASGNVIDHIDNNGLNNQRLNLRECSKLENNLNRTRTAHKNSSKYKGVVWVEKRKKYSVYVTYNKKSHFVGYFIDEVSAARAYDKKALELHGKYANLNFKENE